MNDNNFEKADTQHNTLSVRVENTIYTNKIQSKEDFKQ